MNRQLTMLIVDDMEVERISFAEIFKDEYQILEAENGKQAMEQLEQQKVHIVLLDLCMPANVCVFVSLLLLCFSQTITYSPFFMILYFFAFNTYTYDK